MIGHLLHIPRRVLKALLYVVLFGIFLFVALTRTQVGRDGLRIQFERQFAERFEGRLEIGSLTGNLVYDFFAGDVRLFDPQGHLVAAVDSVTVKPHWRDLFLRQVTFAEVTLFDPDVHLVRDSAGAWNLQQALRRTVPREDPSPWGFNGAKIRLTGGTVTTRNEGSPLPAVAQGQVFDFMNARLLDLDADATLEWHPAERLLDVQHLTARLAEPDVTLQSLSGQIVWDTTSLALNRLVVDTGPTRLDLSASVTNLAAVPEQRWDEAEVDLLFYRSHIDWDDVRRLVPALPLADTLDVSGRLRGPVRELVLESLVAGRGQSRVNMEGTLFGFPDSLDFELAVHDTRLVPDDVRAVWPEAPDDLLDRAGHTQVQVIARGVADWHEAPARIQVQTEGTLQTDTGTAEGTLSYRQHPEQPAAYEGSLTMRAVNLGRLLDDPALQSALRGRVELAGTGTSRETVRGTLALDLGPSTLAGRAIDSLHLDLEAASKQVQASLRAMQGRGRVQASGSLDWGAALPHVAARIRTHRLDLGPLLLDDSLHTDLNAVAEVRGAGATWPDLRGYATLAFDSSSVQHAQTTRSIPAHTSALTVAEHGGTEPRLRLDGDLLFLELDGDVAAEPLAALGRLWGQVLADDWRGIIDKPYPGLNLLDTLAMQPAARPQRQIAALQDATRRAFHEATLDTSLAVHATLRLKRSDVLSALVPSWPMLYTNLQATLHVEGSPHRFHTDLAVQADTIQVGEDVHLETVRGNWINTAVLADDTLGTRRTTLELRADTLTLAEQMLAHPALNIIAEGQQGQITFQTDPDTGDVDVEWAATIELLPDRNELTVYEFALGTHDYTWMNAEPGHLALYREAVVIDGFVLEAEAQQLPEPQHLEVWGAVSAAPQDTLFAQVGALELRQLSELVGLRRPVGGILRGRLALSGGIREPAVTGDLNVNYLALDDRLIGAFRATSSFQPGGGVALDVALEPLQPDSAQAVVERSPFLQRAEENALRLAGTFQLPRFDEARTMIDEGHLDLALRADRIDPFFFDMIFDAVAETEGAFVGQGHIGGTFSKPLFQADMQLQEGRFQVPRFNLTYEASGGVQVNEAGFVLNQVTIADPSGGRAEVNGNILFNDYRYFSFDLVARINELQIMNVRRSEELPFYGRIWASGDATLDGPVYEAHLRSGNATTRSDSEVYIPVQESTGMTDAGFIVFADSTGQLPDLSRITRRSSILARRPEGERTFVDGLEMDLNINAPSGSTVHLVIDPLLGDVINAVGSGRIQLQRQEGEFATYGTLDVDSGDYLFTAGEVFMRRFLIEDGQITWDGDPTNPDLDIQAVYRTRASRAGLPGEVGNAPGLIPLAVRLHITERVEAPVVDLSLDVDQSDRDVIRGYDGLEAILNQPERSTEYATSVLLTNSFLLTTDLASGGASRTGEQLAFNSLSQLVGNQLNRYINQAVPNLDLNLGLQPGTTDEEVDLTYGVALRLLDERLIIRGQGVVENDQEQARQQAFTVEIRLSPRVSVEVFHRREGDMLSIDESTSTTGAGISYQTIFTNWRAFFARLLGLDDGADETDDADEEEEEAAPSPEEPVADYEHLYRRPL